MENCLLVENDDFRGYPWVEIIDLWEVSVPNPCTVNPNDYIKRTFIHSIKENLYRGYDGQLANGVYFQSPGGKGGIIKMTDGVMSPFAIEGLNIETCELGPGDSINTEMLGYAVPIHSDVYNDYIYVVYPERHIVVKYLLGSNLTGKNVVGTIVCGHIDKVDYGNAGESNYLNLPSLIKIDPVSKNIIIFNSGAYKTFKEFNQSGTLIRTWSDIVPGSTSNTNLGFDTITDDIGFGTTSIKGIPTNKDGLMAQLTLRSFWENSSIDVTHRSYGTVMSLDFYTNTTLNRKVIVVGVWYAYNNKFSTYLLIENTSKTSTNNCTCILLDTIPFIGLNSNETEDMLVCYSLFNKPPTTENSISIVIPKNLNDFNNVKEWSIKKINFNIVNTNIASINNKVIGTSYYIHRGDFIMGPGIRATAVMTRNEQVLVNMVLVQRQNFQIIDYGSTKIGQWNLPNNGLAYVNNPDDLNAFIKQYVQTVHEDVASGFTQVMAVITVASFLWMVIVAMSKNKEIMITIGNFLHWKFKLRHSLWITVGLLAITIISAFRDRINARKNKNKVQVSYLLYNSAIVHPQDARSYGHYITPRQAKFMSEYLNCDVAHNNDWIYGISQRDYWVTDGSGVYAFLSVMRKQTIDEEWTDEIMYVPTLSE